MSKQGFLGGKLCGSALFNGIKLISAILFIVGQFKISDLQTVIICKEREQLFSIQHNNTSRI